MSPSHLAKLGAVVLITAAVALVIRFKEADSSSSARDSSGAVGSMILSEQSEASPQVARAGGADLEQPLQSPMDQPQADTALPRLLDLGADKCIPCKKMAPILEALREDFAGQFEVVFIDVWKDRQAAVPYRIKLIPTQIFFDEAGNELLRHQGFFSREDILTTWADVGYKFAASSRDAGE